MSETIGPALTPQEWTEEGGRGCVNSGDFMVYAPLGMDGLVVGPPGPGNGVLLPTDLYHATAAIMFHGQPFGFTWADVDALKFAEWYDQDWDSPRVVQLRSLAARIEALLPPREP